MLGSSQFSRTTLWSSACLLAVLQATPLAGQSGRVLEGRTLQSEALGSAWSYSIYLPPDYDTSEREYPVVYMLHGIGGSHTAWFRYGDAAAVADSFFDRPSVDSTGDPGLSRRLSVVLGRFRP